MILTPIVLEDIQHIQKANTSHERAFESVIDKVYREDKERKEKAKRATRDIIQLKSKHENLLNDAEKLNKSAVKHYQAAEMLKGE